MIFVDLEKTYDKVPREVLWRTLKRKGVNIDYIEVIKDMYAGVVNVVQTQGGLTKYFPISVGVHQGSIHPGSPAPCESTEEPSGFSRVAP